MKDNYLENIFFENEDMPQEDTDFFNRKLSEPLTDAARNFFEQMRKKEEGEYAVCGDLILHYKNSPEGLYIVRYFFYRISNRLQNRR